MMLRAVTTISRAGTRTAHHCAAHHRAATTVAPRHLLLRVRWTPPTRQLSSSSDLAGLTPIDIEKELFKIKRRMGGFYSKGMYHDALVCAVDLEQKVAEVMGTGNAVHASCLNNVALMNKMLGHSDVAMAKYTAALQTYEDVVGKVGVAFKRCRTLSSLTSHPSPPPLTPRQRHPSYVSTLANIGVLYKSLAEAATGMERLQLIERADESLSDAYKLRKYVTSHVNDKH